MTEHAQDYLTPEEAAHHLRLSPRTLEKMRTLGGGPRFCKFGRRVLYARVELEAWAAERSYEMTSELKGGTQAPTIECRRSGSRI